MMTILKLLTRANKWRQTQLCSSLCLDFISELVKMLTSTKGNKNSDGIWIHYILAWCSFDMHNLIRKSITIWSNWIRLSNGAKQILVALFVWVLYQQEWENWFPQMDTKWWNEFGGRPLQYAQLVSAPTDTNSFLN